MPYRKVCGIYDICNTKNNKHYIGQSVNIHSRLSTHKCNLKAGIHQNKELQKEWNEYGEDSFTFNVVTECKAEELDNLESHYINEYDCVANGYNVYNRMKTSMIENLKAIYEGGYYRIHLNLDGVRKSFSSTSEEEVLRKAKDWIQNQEGILRYKYPIELNDDEINLLENILKRAKSNKISYMHL